MSSLRYIFVCTLTFLHLNNAQRRILAGKEMSFERGYVVYLLKADLTVKYDAWICGGAIVNPSYIMTSAACLEDVKHMYAIAGYKKYVTYENINSDECTKAKKKKIVYVCIPSAYTFDYPRVEKWARIDIALAKVETPYDFNDASYKTSCSYIPSQIEINYDIHFQKPGTDAIVFGWGHLQKWRNEDDTTDYNQDNLLYGAVRLASKEECKTFFEDVKVKNIIDKYMICSMVEGNLDDKGDLIITKIDPAQLMTDCAPGLLRMGNKCVKDPYYRRNIANATFFGPTRRKGICQNDHGGPMITWRGPKEIVIGLASVFRVNEESKDCIPPFLYASTYCNGAFLHCLLDEGVSDDPEATRKRCNLAAKEMGIRIIRRTISWVGHPDGPAQNEINENAHTPKDQKTEAENEEIYDEEVVTVITDSRPVRDHKTGNTKKKHPSVPTQPSRDGKTKADVQKSNDDNRKFRDILPRGVNNEKEYQKIRMRPQVSVHPSKH